MKKSVGARILEGLREFTETLEQGKPFVVTRVRRERTPDGPLTTRTTKTVRLQKEKKDGENANP